MDAKPATLELLLEPESHLRLANLCGPQDANLRQIETRLGVSIHNRGHQFHLAGEAAAVERGMSGTTARQGKCATSTAAATAI